MIETGDDILPAVLVKIVAMEEWYPAANGYDEIRLKLATLDPLLDVATRRAMMTAFTQGVVCWLVLPKP